MTLDPRTKRLLPWLVAIAFFMQTLDGSILNTALPRMANDLGESALRMQAVVVSYLLTLALLIPASGWLADRFGTRRVFIGAIALFSLGSLLCAMSSSLGLLVASRVVQGVGGALLLPVGRLAILRVFPKPELLSALSFVAVPGLLGPLVGPSLGGWIVEVATWHWVFLINLPVGAAGAVFALRHMPDLRRPVDRFDTVGFGLFSAGLLLATLALQGLGERAFSGAASLLMLVVSLAAMVAYWLHAVRHERPLFSPALFHIPTFAVGLAGNLFARLGSGAMPFLLPLFLQLGLGYSPARAGMSLIPMAVGAMLCKSFAAPLIRRAGYRRVLGINTVLLGAMIASFAAVGPALPSAALLSMLGILGVINSLQFTAMNTLTLGDLGPTQASSGNSLLSVVMQLSMSLGVAAAAALLAAFAGALPLPGSATLMHAFQATFISIGAMAAASALIFLQLRPGEQPDRTRPGAVEEG
ncbi:multidrug transporter subunit MdtD [Ideonella sp. DXS29W]|uniref:Multidrug transporter subunit MdtD n=1 Tax=Ideonella lacteola TaxID=2984193 RepID=A0ABU9BS93_9BURK